MTQYIVFLILAPIAAVTSLITFFICVSFRKTLGFPTLRLVIVSQTLYVVCNFLELYSPDEAGTLFWASAGYLFVSSGMIAWFLFGLEYSGNNRWLKPSRVWIFFLIPAITMIAVATNPLYHLIWKRYTFVPVMGMLAMRVPEYGPWLWVHFIYGYILFLSSSFMIVREYFLGNHLFRRQSLWILFGIFVPLCFNAIYVLKLIPGLTKDFTPVAFALGSVSFAVGIFRYKFLIVRPFSRRTLVDRMKSGIVVVDRKGLILDANSSAVSLLGLKENEIVTNRMSSVLPRWDESFFPAEGSPDNRMTVSLVRNDFVKTLALRISSLGTESDHPDAYQVELHETTESSCASVDVSDQLSGEIHPTLCINASGKVQGTCNLSDILDIPEEELLTKSIFDLVSESFSLSSINLSPVSLTFMKRSGETFSASVSIRERLNDRDMIEGYTLKLVELRFPRSIFSFREYQIVELMKEGRTNKEIAEHLFVSENTVKSHIKNIYRKTGSNKKSALLDRLKA